MADEIDEAFRRRAAAALRRRAERQRQRASEWTITAENGVHIISGEGRIAERLALVLDEIALEIEAGRS